jgi:hypothetical protein
VQFRVAIDKGVCLLDKRFVDSPYDYRALVAASAEAALTQIDHGPDCSGVAETAIDHK